MPKPLSDYSWVDLLRLQPLIHGLKTRRYRRIDRDYLRLPAPDGDLARLAAELTGRNVLVTVAFEDHEPLELHLRLCRRFVPGCVHLVADNSATTAGAEAIRRVAAREAAAYVRLPTNPWTRRNPSRSHGAAMNYVWHHLLKPGRPARFGFLDHDLFPTAPDDPFAVLDEVAWYGDLRHAGTRWFLWAGYCFFRYDAVADVPLDFGLDWFAGLDTGGANWEHLYHDVDPERLPQRPIRTVPAWEGADPAQACLEWRGTWLHEVGFGDDRSHRREKRAAVKALLAPLLADDDRSRESSRQPPAGP